MVRLLEELGENLRLSQKSFFLRLLVNIELAKKSTHLYCVIENRLHWVLDITFNEDSKRHHKYHIFKKKYHLCNDLHLKAYD